jgi:glycosyltransferase involved in cell wall biosynthesis
VIVHTLQISPYVIHPPTTGGDHRTHGLVTEFTQLGSTVSRFCQGGSPDIYRDLDLRREIQVDEEYTEYRHLNPIHDLSMAPVLLGYPNLFASRSLRLASGPLNRLIDSADILLVREPWQFPVVRDRTDKPIVYSSHNVEVDRFASTMSLPFSKQALDRTRHLEERAVEESDTVVCTSARDAERYRELFDPEAPIVVHPNGTYESNLREHRPDSEDAAALRRRYGIDSSATVGLFVGSDYGPNVEAAEHVFEMARETSTTYPNIHFLIVGSVANSVASPPPNVTVTGFVENFEAHIDLADIGLNPMLSGGGTNIKVLDYFARSLPVVSTSFGLRGLDAEDGKSVVVARIDEFTTAIGSLAEDEHRRRDLGQAARRLARSRYTWEAASRDLHDHLEELL